MSGSDDLRRRLAGAPIRGSAGEAPAGDFWVAHNAARRGSLLLGLLPLGDANAATLDLLRRHRETSIPVIAGLCATDPFRDRGRLLAEVAELGAVGVINVPSVGMIDGQFGKNLEAADLGYAREVELIRAAARAGLATLGLVFDAAQAKAMADAGADALVWHGEAPAEGRVLVWRGMSIAIR